MNKTNKQYSSAKLTRLWAEPSLTNDDIAAQIGISTRTLGFRAVAYGLPKRKKGARHKIKDHALFSQMCGSGLCPDDIAAHFGVSRRTVEHHRERLGLVPIGRGVRPKISLMGFFMARSAEETRQAMRAA